jgi:DNA-binding winged helix-turn-helix (wHTH) protein
MAAKEKLAYHFEGFVLEDEDFRLTRDRNRVVLEPKSLRVLIALVRSKGKLVPKNAPLEEVWRARLSKRRPSCAPSPY